VLYLQNHNQLCVELSNLSNLDVDECRTGEHNCQQLCNNLLGTYNCSCNTGFMLDNDSRTCSGKHLGRVNFVIHFDFVSEKCNLYKLLYK